MAIQNVKRTNSDYGIYRNASDRKIGEQYQTEKETKRIPDDSKALIRMLPRTLPHAPTHVRVLHFHYHTISYLNSRLPNK
ncbi:hypothetical protein G7K_5636-t1 [Saitoella complicata NRRL Y-17804]|uniref:Uncharacterized protein n=1 Tax=Saitoella complicata (strain BCRC 22490 / CBS 7301 / JCM 7358 / NBRC 10748 / NRRL Y-17804) TaxID=698492 RepID=A0A0E9NNT4_SAICN|nr:hypothetical protein G7K_5636-t1 [Saitoella complicata NRRL Y-17804]